MYKSLSELKKMNDLHLEVSKKSEHDLISKDVQVASKHMKRFPTSHVTRHLKIIQQ
jgi:hypothetical protein